MRRVTGCEEPSDRGAVALLVAILFGFGALLAVAALSIDVGQLYAERRQLQNGADAAALALAQGCAQAHTSCNADTGPGSEADDYADRNAKDGASRVTNVCGFGSPGLPACSPTSGRWVDCQALPPTGTQYVQVRTRTEMSDGSTLFPRTFAKLFVDSAADPGTPVTACARANWGGVRAMTGGFALTISKCEWNSMTADGTDFAPYPPPYSPLPAPPAPSYERVIRLNLTPGTTTCKAGPGGAEIPGGFGWTDDGASSDCLTDVDVDKTYENKTGFGTPDACKDGLLAAWTNRTPVFLPIYINVTGTGGTGTYTADPDGVAAFVVTGYHLAGAKRDSWLPSTTITGATKCKGDDKCIYGFFTKALAPLGSSPVTGGSGMGATAVGMIP